MMGCDIHLYKEKRVNGAWVSADSEWEDNGDDCAADVPWEKRFTDRNYKLFGILSKGVRYECPLSIDERGFPADACPQVLAAYQSWGEDAHSASFLGLAELIILSTRLQESTITISGVKDADQLADFEASIKSEQPDWNLLYPYAAWAGSSSYVPFSVEVPATFIAGGSLEEIIKSFDGVDGDEQRIVFWFDN